jgi:lipoprotein-anchoring transpeptidase ErfK/SrfK
LACASCHLPLRNKKDLAGREGGINQYWRKCGRIRLDTFLGARDFKMRIKNFLTVAIVATVLAGCTTGAAVFTQAYGTKRDAAYQLPSIPIHKIDRKYHRQVVKYETREEPGTIIVDTKEKFLYFVMPEGKAMRYGIGVGRDGFTWSGTHRVTRKAEWPGWTPPPQMIRREAAKGVTLPAYMAGGLKNPLGARALYIGSTIYRIHGSPEWNSIGRNVSSGCIRLMNQDIIDLYDRAKVGAKVIVR